MESDAVLKEALVRLRRELKERGFRSRGTAFHRRTPDGNVIILSIQRSSKSTRVKSEVTLNYGVYSTLVGNKLQDDPSSAMDIANAHWRKRFSEGGREKWFSVVAEDSPDSCARMLLDAAESV